MGMADSADCKRLIKNNIMRCIKCGNVMQCTGDDYINSLCGICKNKVEAEKYSAPLQGWMCPRCGKCWSPFALVCDCPPHTINTNTVGSIIIEDRSHLITINDGMDD